MKYLDVAAEANEQAKALMDIVPEADKKRAAEIIARLVNLGIRCSPRAVQSTVRLNAVKRAVQGLPVRVTMEKRKDDKTGMEYNVLLTAQI